MSVFKITSSVNGKNFPSASDGLSEVDRLNAKRQKLLETMNLPMARASVYLDRWVQANFKTEGGLVGKWAPFSMGGRLVTDNQGNTRIDTTAVLLQLTGKLRSSFKPFHTKNTAGIGSSLDYSEKHHKGIGVQERRLLPNKDEVIKDIRKILKMHVANSLKLKDRS